MKKRIISCQSAQCKQAAFDILKLVLIQADVSRSFFQLIDRLVNVNQRLVKHTDNFVILTVDQSIRRQVLPKPLLPLHVLMLFWRL